MKRDWYYRGYRGVFLHPDGQLALIREGNGGGGRWLALQPTRLFGLLYRRNDHHVAPSAWCDSCLVIR